jgi:adenine-specific DNA-methyltransferase
MIKYLGSKRLLLDDIHATITEWPLRDGSEARSVLDVFSGTSRVGHHLKKQGLQVKSNDLYTYAKVLADCYVGTSRDDEEVSQAKEIIDSFNQMDFDHIKEPGYFEETFCIKSRFFHPKNGRKIDGIRNLIEENDLPWKIKCVLLTSLMEAADRVDSTCGVQMAYLKSWAPRAHNDLRLRMPELVPASPYGPGEAYQLDAADFVRQVEADVAYLDPPYNQHSYLGNYHVWETLCKWDAPEDYGIACKRTDVRTRKSAFNSKRKAKEAFEEVIAGLKTKLIVVSFSDEGFIPFEEMKEILATRGTVSWFGRDYKRYVGAQIGIHNLQGEKVGRVSHLRNKEYIYIVDVNIEGN